MKEESEEREFQAEEQPLQRLWGVEGHGVMRPHQDFWSSWDRQYGANEGQELRSHNAKGEEGPLLKTRPIVVSNTPHTRIMISS